LAYEKADAYREIVPLERQKGLAAQCAAEEKAFGASHADIGAYLLALWGYPPSVVDAVSYHARPDSITIPFIDLTALLHVAHALVCAEGKEEEMNTGYLQKLGIADRVPKWKEIYAGLKQTDALKSWKFS
jgi:HD-like signal output (HDOD) protein